MQREQKINVKKAQIALSTDEKSKRFEKFKILDRAREWAKFRRPETRRPKKKDINFFF